MRTLAIKSPWASLRRRSGMPLPFVSMGESPTLIFPGHDEVEALFAALGRPARQRTTLYGSLQPAIA